MRKRAAIVGATGIAGQQFIACLQEHPWFEIVALSASERSAGKTYGEALRDPKTGSRRWWCQEEPLPEILEMPVVNAAELDTQGIDVVFSAVESEVAKTLEPRFAQTSAVISTASAFRYEEDVPLLIPGVNFDHAPLINVQREKRGTKGFIVPIPNCTTTGLAITLKPLMDAFGLRRVYMTSMQGISGAGRSPGVVALDIVDNIIPYIPGEEEKVQKETQKILGRFIGSSIQPADFAVSCTCTRTSVLEGHTEAVFVETERKATVEEAKKVMREYGVDLYKMNLPSAPSRMIVVHEDPFRPQPRLDRDAEGGMATSVGRLREDPAVEKGLKYILVSHNTKMGAAKGAVLVAEFLAIEGYF